MKPIPDEFVGRADQGRSGNLPAYRFKLLQRQDRVCLLEKSRGGTGQKLYEVVLLRSLPERAFPGGNTCPAHESMPSPEMWGGCAWSPATLVDALTKFDEVLRGGAPNAP